MAVTHPVAVRNAIADLVVDGLDLGSGTLEGRMILQTAGAAEVATLNLANPAFGAAAAGVATANAIANDASATGGVTTQGVLTDRDATTRVSFSVTGTGGGGDVQLSSTNIQAGDQVQITSLTYTAPN